MLKDIWRLSEEEFVRLRQVDPGKLALCAFLFNRSLKRDRIPDIVRRPAPVYGGKSMLDCILADRIDEVVEQGFDLFYWPSS